MSDSPLIPPHPTPRRLYRSRSNRIVGGVCGGVADYLNLDPTIVRVLTVVLTLFTGVPVAAYLVALLVIPDEPLPSEPDRRPPVTSGSVDPVWGPTGAPWEQAMDSAAGRTTQTASPADPAAGAATQASADQPGEPTPR